MTRILNQPLLATTSYIPGNQGNTKFTAEMIMLFWEITQCNKRFRSFMIDTERSHDFVILVLFYALEYKLDASKQGVVRMCVFLLQTLSVEPNFGKNLNNKFEAQDTLPATIRLQNFNGTYGDFLIHVSCGNLYFLYVLMTDYCSANIQHHYDESREAACDISSTTGSHQQHCCISWEPECFSFFQTPPPLLINVVSWIFTSQWEQPWPSSLVVRKHECSHWTSVHQ